MALLVTLLDVEVSGRISSVPVEPSLEPEENQVLRMSSSAMVRPGSTSICVCRPFPSPSSPLGVKVIWYFSGCGEVLVRRTSDWKWELKPSAWATAGMIKGTGGGGGFGGGGGGLGEVGGEGGGVL